MPLFPAEILELIGAQYDPQSPDPTEFHSVALASPAFLYGVRCARFRRVSITQTFPLYDFRRRMDQFAAILPTISLFVHEMDLEVYPDLTVERSLHRLAQHLVQACNIRHLSLKGPFTLMGNMAFPRGLLSLVNLPSLTSLYLSFFSELPRSAIAGLHLTGMVLVEDCAFEDSGKYVNFDFEANRRLAITIWSSMPALPSFLPAHAIDVPDIQISFSPYVANLTTDWSVFTSLTTLTLSSSQYPVYHETTLDFPSFVLPISRVLHTFRIDFALDGPLRIGSNKRIIPPPFPSMGRFLDRRIYTALNHMELVVTIEPIKKSGAKRLKKYVRRSAFGLLQKDKRVAVVVEFYSD
ncbi:hypothetical protein CVT26_014296 [Gymnopilus dilepis]|uniref:Uncharacterized protein n=1 Tax=Gymnopilus dilepis TaxID=231916 RepID=A0A409X233_9AGAR|nr:hypothetical protein CVT26_014296 [Gymnopilus dilepis]